MRKYVFNIICWCILGSIGYACSDIIEQDISEEIPQIIGPGEENIEYGTLTFWWEEVEGASRYRVQIVAPDFDSPQRIFVDTLVNTNKFDFTPLPGIYQWRVQAQNSAYSSAFSDPRNLTIIEGNDLGRVKVILSSPGVNAAVNYLDIEFTWEEVPIAEGYRFQLYSNAGVLIDDTVDTGLYLYTFPGEDRTYQWSVTAFNSNSESMSETRSLIIDRTSPTSPALIAPKEDSLVDFSFDLRLRWQRTASDVVADSLYIYHEGSDNLVPGFPPLRLLVTEYDLSNLTTIFKEDSSYRWSVVSVDRAGNYSQSSQRTFKVDVE